MTQAPLTVTATGGTQVYNATTAANVTLASNAFNGDTMVLSDVSATMADKNVGNGKGVSVTGIAVAGANAGNYALQNTTASTTTNVTPRTLNLTFTVADKTFDGSAVAASTVSDSRVSGDNLTVKYAAAFADQKAGNGKPVAISSLAPGGADAGNYVVAANASNGVTGNLLARSVTYTLAPQDPAKTYTATGQALVTTAQVDQIVAASWANTVNGFAPGALSYTIWKDGVQVAAIKEAGAYEIHAAFAVADPHYALTSTGNTVLSVTVNAAPGVVGQAVRTETQRGDAMQAAMGIPAVRSVAEFNPAAPNVVASLSGINARFGEGTALSVISSPGANEPTESVTLAQAKRMVAAAGGGATGEREVRVPVNRNSLAEIVNGGVKLPDGVEQTLFVVKAN